jgi:class 3 adenylate cyclase
VFVLVLHRIQIISAAARRRFLLRITKFVGDGWLLFFPDALTGEPPVHGDAILDYLDGLERLYRSAYRHEIQPRLSNPPAITGLTYGIDAGLLLPVTLSGRREYVGWPLNLACRLQGAIKDQDERPQKKVLMSQNVYERHKQRLDRFQPSPVVRRLRNVRGADDVACVKLALDVAVEENH